MAEKKTNLLTGEAKERARKTFGVDKLSPKQKEKMQVMYKYERTPGSDGYKPTKTDIGPNYKTKNASVSSKNFKDSFAEARKGGQKEFTWNGKKYNTNLASDKKPESKVSQDIKPNESNAPSPFRPKKVEEAAPTKKEMSTMDKVKDVIGVGREATEKEKMGRSLQDAARRSMGMKKGGKVKKMAKGGSVKCKRDGCAVRGKTKGKLY